MHKDINTILSKFFCFILFLDDLLGQQLPSWLVIIIISLFHNGENRKRKKGNKIKITDAKKW